MEEMIRTENLTKCYHGKPVVDGVKLEVPKKAIYGFLGPNGAGKSTTMKMPVSYTHLDVYKRQTLRSGERHLPGWPCLMKRMRMATGRECEHLVKSAKNDSLLRIS